MRHLSAFPPLSLLANFASFSTLSYSSILLSACLFLLKFACFGSRNKHNAYSNQPKAAQDKGAQTRQFATLPHTVYATLSLWLHSNCALFTFGSAELASRRKTLANLRRIEAKIGEKWMKIEKNRKIWSKFYSSCSPLANEDCLWSI